MTREAAPADERSRSLDDLVADYLESVEAGRPLDRTELLLRHPEWSADLRAFFTAHDRFDGLLAPLRVPGTLPSVSDTPAEGPRRPEPQAGDRVGNHELIEELGRGGMGVVWKARDVRLGRDVAVKMLLTDSDVDGRRRFRLEAEAVAGLDHPNVVPIYEVGEQDGRPFFSMKLIEGGNLARQIAHRAQPPRDAARLLAVVARAVDYAHQRGILHRDLKPANILLQIADRRSQIESQPPTPREPDAGNPICNLQSAICNPFVSDFGLARRLEADSGLTPTGIALGTPSYMAPEQALPKGGGRRPQPTIAADVYSLGAILYEVLTGRAPFRAETPLQTLLEALHTEAPRPRALAPGVPVELETVCLKCLDKDPARRYPTAAALAEDLERFLAGEPVQARPLGPLARWWRWCRRHPVPAALSAALAVSIVAGLAVSTWQWSRAEGHYREALNNLDRANREFERAEAHARDADAGFNLAHQSVIRFFNRFSEQPVFRETPAFRAVRRKMLLEARDYFERFLARRDDPVLRAELAATYSRIAAIDDEIGSRAEALAGFRQARALFEKSAAEAPANRAIRVDLTRTIHRAALLEATAGASADALRDYELARDRFSALLEDEPANAAVLGDLAAVLNNLGALYRKLGRPADARACFEEKISRAQELSRLGPDDPAAAVTLAVGWLALGRLDASEGRLAERACCDLVAREILERQWERTPGNTGVRRELAALYRHLGGRLSQERRYAEAVEPLERSVDILEKLTAEDPEFIGYQVDLSVSLRQLGHTLRDAGRPDTALARYRRALAVSEAVLARDADTPGHRSDVAATQFDVGTALGAMNRWAEAEKSFARAVERRREAPRAVRQEAGQQYSLGLALKNLAAARWNLGNRAPAREAAREAADAFRAAASGAPRSAEYRRALADCLGTVVTFEVAGGRASAALPAARERLRLAGEDPGQLYATARDLARVAGAGDVDSPEDEAARSDAAELAARALRLAIDRGFADAERFRSDDAFTAVRRRPDFPTLPPRPPSAP